MAAVYRSYLAANDGFQDMCHLPTRVDAIMQHIEKLVGTFTQNGELAINNTPTFIANKVDLARKTLVACLEKKDETFLTRLTQRIVKHSVGITAAFVAMYQATTLTGMLASITTLASILGLEEETFVQICASMASVLGEFGDIDDIELHADVPLEKISILLTTVLGMMGGGPSPISQVLKATGSAVRNAEGLSKVWKMIEDIAATMGFPLSERSKELLKLKENIEEVAKAGLEHQARFTVSASDYCRDSIKRSFDTYRQKVHELYQYVSAPKMKDLVSQAQILEVSRLAKKVDEMSVEINRLSALTGVRPEPIGVIFQGESSIGKSSFVEKLCSEVKNKLARVYLADPLKKEHQFLEYVDEWMVWDQNPADDYDQGYVGQEIHSIDDCFQRADQKDHAKLINYVSTRPLPTHQAAIEDKGLPYKARLLVASCNHFPTSSVVVNSIEALSNRFLYKVKCELRPGHQKPRRGGGQFDPTFPWLKLTAPTRRGEIEITLDILATQIALSLIANEKKYLSVLDGVFRARQVRQQAQVQRPVDVVVDIDEVNQGHFQSNSTISDNSQVDLDEFEEDWDDAEEDVESVSSGASWISGDLPFSTDELLERPRILTMDELLRTVNPHSPCYLNVRIDAEDVVERVSLDHLLRFHPEMRDIDLFATSVSVHEDSLVTQHVLNECLSQGFWHVEQDSGYERPLFFYRRRWRYSPSVFEFDEWWQHQLMIGDRVAWDPHVEEVHTSFLSNWATTLKELVSSVGSSCAAAFTWLYERFFPALDAWGKMRNMMLLLGLIRSSPVIITTLWEILCCIGRAIRRLYRKEQIQQEQAPPKVADTRNYFESSHLVSEELIKKLTQEEKFRLEASEGKSFLQKFFGRSDEDIIQTYRENVHLLSPGLRKEVEKQYGFKFDTTEDTVLEKESFLQKVFGRSTEEIIATYKQNSYLMSPELKKEIEEQYGFKFEASADQALRTKKSRVVKEDSSAQQQRQKKVRTVKENKVKTPAEVSQNVLEYTSLIKRAKKTVQQEKFIQLDTTDDDVKEAPSSDSEGEECEIPETALEACYDPNGVAILESLLQKNVKRVKFGSSSLYGWATGKHFVFPSHLVNAVGDCIRVELGTEDVECIVVAVKREWDLALAQFPKHIPAFPTLMHHLLSDVDITSGNRQFTGMLAYPTRKTSIIQVVSFAFADELKVHHGSTTRKVEPIVVVRGYHTHGMASQAGDCGGPLIEINKTSAKKLIGMHIACGTDGTKGYSTIVTTERLNALLEFSLDYTVPKGKDVKFQAFRNVTKVRKDKSACYGLACGDYIIVPHHLDEEETKIQYLHEESSAWHDAHFRGGWPDRDLSVYGLDPRFVFEDISDRFIDKLPDECFKIEAQVELMQSCQMFQGHMIYDSDTIRFANGVEVYQVFMVALGTDCPDPVPGDCGSVMVAETGHIFGIVTYGLSEMTEIGVSAISKEILGQCLFPKERVYFEGEIKSKRFAFAEPSELNPNDGNLFGNDGYGIHLPPGDFDYLGDIIGASCMAAPKQSDLGATPFAFPFKKQKVPSVLNLKDKRVKDISHLPINGLGQPDLLISQCAKYGAEPVDMDKKILGTIVKQLVDYSVLVLDKEKLSPKDDGKRWWEAINGRVGDEYFTPMNIKASAGVPWSREGSTKKAAYLCDAEARYHGQTVKGKMPTDSRMWHVTEEKLRLAREGLRTHSVWKDCLKDELRPVEKIEKPKTRLFSCAPMETVLVARFLFEPYKAAWMRHHEAFFHAVGIDPKSSDWQFLAQQLRSFGKDVADGDFSSFDGNLPADLMEAVGAIVIETIDRITHDGDKLARYVLWDEFVSTIQVAEETVYMSKHGNPSGNPMTTVLNCWANFILHWYCYIRLTGDTSLSSFLRDVFFRSFGDDCIYSVRLDATAVYNPVAISEVMAEVGQGYTNGSKTVQGSFSRIEEVQFLKRRFKFSDVATVVLAPLEQASIEGCFNYSQILYADGETWANTTFEQLLEMALHSKDYYEKNVAKLRQKLRDMPLTLKGVLLPVLSTTYDSAMAELKRRYGLSAVSLERK